MIWEAVKERERETSSNDKDLLHSILEGAINDDNVGEDSSRKFIVDNCKNIYFAGHESTAVAASWCLMLLALHPEWQSRIGEEMAQICPDGVLDADSVSKMKMVLTMSILVLNCVTISFKKLDIFNYLICYVSTILR